MAKFALLTKNRNLDTIAHIIDMMIWLQLHTYVDTIYTFSKCLVVEFFIWYPTNINV